MKTRFVSAGGLGGGAFAFDCDTRVRGKDAVAVGRHLGCCTLWEGDLIDVLCNDGYLCEAALATHPFNLRMALVIIPDAPSIHVQDARPAYAGRYP